MFPVSFFLLSSFSQFIFWSLFISRIFFLYFPLPAFSALHPKKRNEWLMVSCRRSRYWLQEKPQGGIVEVRVAARVAAGVVVGWLLLQE